MKKKVAFYLLVGFLFGLTSKSASALDCSNMNEINQLLDSYQAAAKIKDDVALSNLISTSYLGMNINNSYVPPTSYSWNYNAWLSWNATGKANNDLYSNYLISNRNIIEIQGSKKILLSAEGYITWALPNLVVTKNRSFITIVEENNKCVILDKIDLEYYNSFIPQNP